MNLGQLVAEVVRKVQDSSYASATIKQQIIDAHVEICRLVHIPPLIRNSTLVFTDGEQWATLPSEYSHDVFTVHNLTTDDPVTIRSNVRHLLAKYSDVHAREGNIYDCAIEGKRMYVGHTSEGTQNLDVWYYKDVTEMAATTSVPAHIPSHLHRMISDKVCMDIFEEIEDGMEGGSPNTQKYGNRFGQGLQLLAAWYPQPAMHTPSIRADVHWF